ncbi:MAG TPA: hypothetical protein VFU37_10985 [Pyrinomonadaceae bacterium]|nr:hypothetical protein [Pyrinomonadaceae bacterium]
MLALHLGLFCAPAPLLQESFQSQTMFKRGSIAAGEPIGDVLPWYAKHSCNLGAPSVLGVNSFCFKHPRTPFAPNQADEFLFQVAALRWINGGVSSQQGLDFRRPCKNEWLSKLNQASSAVPVIPPVVLSWLQKECQLIDFATA